MLFFYANLELKNNQLLLFYKKSEGLVLHPSFSVLFGCSGSGMKTFLNLGLRVKNKHASRINNTVGEVENNVVSLSISKCFGSVSDIVNLLPAGSQARRGFPPCSPAKWLEVVFTNLVTSE
jgi:hypothetical protein